MGRKEGRRTGKKNHETLLPSVQINLIAPPLYVMTTTTMERNEGLELLNRAIARVEETIKAAGGVFNVQNAPKVVTDMDELELEKQLKSLEEENREVDGDDDNDDDAAPPKVVVVELPPKIIENISFIWLFLALYSVTAQSLSALRCPPVHCSPIWTMNWCMHMGECASLIRVQLPSDHFVHLPQIAGRIRQRRGGWHWSWQCGRSW